MYLKEFATGKRELLFDATNAKHTPPRTRPLEQQGERESQKLWYSTVQGLLARDHDVATAEKTKIEDRQREEAAQRAEQGIEWQPRLFRPVRGGPGGSEEGEEGLDFIINAEIDHKDFSKVHDQILAITPIVDGQVASRRPDVPQSAGRGADENDNLIDFDNDHVITTQQTAAPTKQQGDLLGDDDAHRSATESSMMAPLQPTNSTSSQLSERRKSTDSDDRDEFVDAQEQQ